MVRERIPKKEIFPVVRLIDGWNARNKGFHKINLFSFDHFIRIHFIILNSKIENYPTAFKTFKIIPGSFFSPKMSFFQSPQKILFRFSLPSSCHQLVQMCAIPPIHNATQDCGKNEDGCNLNDLNDFGAISRFKLSRPNYSDLDSDQLGRKSWQL